MIRWCAGMKNGNGNGNVKMQKCKMAQMAKMSNEACPKMSLSNGVSSVQE